MGPVTFDHVLFPGRHHLVTDFQMSLLGSLLRGALRLPGQGQISPGADVVWVVTSATHSGTRRNPLPGSRREALIEHVTTREGLRSRVALVPDVAPSPRFASTVLGSLELTLGQRFTPADTVVACSTPAVAAMYTAAGFTVIPVEDSLTPPRPRPWDVLEMLVAGDPRWRELAHPACVDFYDRYDLAAAVTTCHTDPTVGGDGDLTDTRDYATYTASFDGASDRKWAQVAPFVVPGRVVDLGCAAGGLLERAAADPRLAESDLYGVDVARHLIADAEHRKAQGVFANPNVFFAQRNLLRGPVFPAASVNTTITIALTHEISSYGAGRADLELLARRVFEHTAPGGVWINSDVLGPVDGDRLVDLHLSGAPTDPVDLSGWDARSVHDHVAALSPAGKLAQFARDFPALSGGSCAVTWLPVQEAGTAVARLTLRAAMEFMYTRDYVDNWLSECHERFCDMTWRDWVEVVTAAGFEVAAGSGPWRNDWLVGNRLQVGAALTDAGTGIGLPWPDTHVLMVARRPV